MGNWDLHQRVYTLAHEGRETFPQFLAMVTREKAYTHLDHPMHPERGYSTLAEYCEQFLELDLVAVRAIVSSAKVDDEDRRTVLRALDEETPAVAGHGANQWSGVRVTKSNGEDDREYVIGRLKRDDPALAQLVIDDEISANEAAIRAGIRHQYARIRTDNVDKAISVLRRHYTDDEIRRALS